MAHSRREAWLQASVEITSAVLAGTGPDGWWPLIATGARAASEGDLGAVWLPTEDRPGWLTIAAADGEDAETQLGASVPLEGSITGLSMIKGELLRWDDMANDDRLYPPARSRLAPFGPGMCVPIVDPEGARLGVLGVAKCRGRPAFDEQDVAMLFSFAEQAVLARRLDDHRAQGEELRLLEERDRIAHDMHDHALQELFATGLTLQGIATAASGELQQRLLHMVNKLDDVITQVRTTVYGLPRPPVRHEPSAGGLQRRLREVIRDSTGPLGFAPSLHVAGPVALVTAPITRDLLAVVREALSNTARHANATTVTVDVVASPTELAVRVTDNGRGIGDTSRRSGLHNLRVRAERHQGALIVDSCAEGTTLTWTVPLTRSAMSPVSDGPELVAATA